MGLIMKNKTSITLLALSLFSSLTWADCIDKIVTKLDSQKVKQGQCQIVRPLSLQAGFVYVPSIASQSIKVLYWDALIKRNIKIQSRYLVKYVDLCRRHPAVITEDIVTKTKKQVEYLQLENPNLDPNIRASFDLLPMTQDEAKLELNKLVQICNKKMVN